MPFKGEITFTTAEKQAHDANVATITRVARKYLEDTWNTHIAFHQRHGVSKYYGDRNQSLNTRAKRVAALQAAGKPTSLVDQLQPTSCVGLVLNSLAAGFREPGDTNLEKAWKKAYDYTRLNDVDGSALLDALQKLGWKLLYWNPEPQNNEKWDREDGDRKSKGSHAWRYYTVMNRGTYYHNKVDDKSTLVGFGTSVPASFRNVGYFAGVAHAGYHVFPGFNGDVIEAHSTRRLTSIDNLEKSAFNPLARGGAPRWTSSEKYRSGLIGIPPA